MAYTVNYTPAVEKDLRRLPRQDQERLLQAMDALGADPRPHGVETLEDRSGLLRIRIGSYRIVYSVSDSPPEVNIILVGDRKDVYKKLLRRLR